MRLRPNSEIIYDDDGIAAVSGSYGKSALPEILPQTRKTDRFSAAVIAIGSARYHIKWIARIISWRGRQYDVPRSNFTSIAES